MIITRNTNLAKLIEEARDGRGCHYLHISGVEVSIRFIEAIEEVLRIQKNFPWVEIKSCKGNVDALLALIMRLPALERLRISNTIDTEEGSFYSSLGSGLQHTPSLKDLRVDLFYMPPKSTKTHTWDLFVAGMKKNNTLSNITLNKYHLLGRDKIARLAPALCGLNNLVRLSLESSDTFGTVVFEVSPLIQLLRTNARLENIKLCAAALHVSDMRALADMCVASKRICCLHLTRCGITDEGMVAFFQKLPWMGSLSALVVTRSCNDAFGPSVHAALLEGMRDGATRGNASLRHVLLPNWHSEDLAFYLRLNHSGCRKDLEDMGMDEWLQIVQLIVRVPFMNNTGSLYYFLRRSSHMWSHHCIETKTGHVTKAPR